MLRIISNRVLQVQCYPILSHKEPLIRTLSCGSPNHQTSDRQRELMARSLPKRAPLPGVKHIVVVASGKGGVGKSTTASNFHGPNWKPAIIMLVKSERYPVGNLAVSLAQLGHRVGLLDADIFGPSVPLMMNVHETPLVNDANQMIPPVSFNVKCLSMGLLVDDDKPIVWRGPLVMSALQRLLRGATWSPLDILVVDTPPGTGDIHLSLGQNVPLAGVLLVSTPQRAALNVTRRGAEMYAQAMRVPLIGVVENMSSVECTSCGAQVPLFDDSGMREFCEALQVRVLARMPMDRRIGEAGDGGRPMVVLGGAGGADGPDGADGSSEAVTYAQRMATVAKEVCAFLKL